MNVHMLPGPPAVARPVPFPFFSPESFLLPLIGVIVIVLFVVAGVRGESNMQGERRGRWLPLVYYYLATIVGLALVLIGIIGGLHGLVTAALPSTSDQVTFMEPPFNAQGDPVKETPSEKAQREAEALKRARQSGYADSIQGGITAIVGLPVFLWHLLQARRKEPEWLGTSS